MINSQEVRKLIAPESVKDFDDINNHIVLGASNHIKMIGDMIESICRDEKNKNGNLESLKSRIIKLTEFFKETRGKASQAITNAILIMTKGLNSTMNENSLEANIELILKAKDSYAIENQNAINKIIHYSLNLIQNKKNIFIFDYSSTVEKILYQLPNNYYNIFIPESRIIDGGKPYLNVCLNKKYQIHFFPDAAIMYYLKQSDCVLMGAETYYPDGTGFNTTGSDIVGLVAKYYNIPLYFVTPLIKLDIRPLYGCCKELVYDDLNIKLRHRIDSYLENAKIDFIVPELIAVIPEHITAYITEQGIIPPNAMFNISMNYYQQLQGEKVYV